MSQSSPPIKTGRPEAERIAALKATLAQRPGVDPTMIRIVKAPLRVCPLGAHIDHQLGQVTGMALDQAILFAFAPTEDGAVQVESANFSPAVHFSLTDVPPCQPGDWGNYLCGAVLALQQHYQLRRGLIGIMDGEVPIGGLSSSAAVTTAYLLALEAVNNLSVSPEENISFARFTENSYIGLNNGILDQTVILCSQKQHLTYIDCQTVQIEQIPAAAQMADFELMVVYSGLSHALVGTDYNNRVAECQEAGRLLLDYAQQPQNPSNGPLRLRHISPTIFAQEGHRLPEKLRRRAQHYFGEMARVEQGREAWQQGDIHTFGRLVSESGYSSVHSYESGCPQLITLYELLSQTAGVYGTRFSGAGFRGSCIAIIDPSARESIADSIHRFYPYQHPNQAERYSIHFCQSGDAAHLVEG